MASVLDRQARRLAESTRLSGMDDHDGQARGTQDPCSLMFQATGRFHYDGAQGGEGFSDEGAGV